MNPRLRRRLFSWAGTAAVLAALALLDAASQLAPARLDLSAGRVYSLSAGTKAALARLEQPLVIQVYFTPRLPVPFSVNERYLRDLLAEYRAAGRGRVTIEWSDPERDEATRRRAEEAGVTPVQINLTGRDRFEAKQAWMGVVLLYGGKSRTLSVVEGPQDLEYELTRRLRRLTSPRLNIVGFVAGHGEKAPGDPQLAAFFGAVSELVEARAVSLSKPLPPDLDALWLAGPSTALKPAELAALLAFAKSGKPLVVLTNTRIADFVQFHASPVDAGLAPLLAAWGLTQGTGFVVDRQAERVQLEAPAGRFTAMRLVEYPFVPIATKLDSSQPAVAGLDAIPFPFVNPIRFDGSKAPGVAYRSLADSSHLSWETQAADVSPGRALESLRSDKPGPLSLAGVATGPAGKLLVVGTSYQLDPRLVEKAPIAAFLLNLVDWSTQDETLLSARGKGLEYRPLRPLPPAATTALKYALLALLPLAALLLLALRHRARSARRRALAARFADA